MTSTTVYISLFLTCAVILALSCLLVSIAIICSIYTIFECFFFSFLFFFSLAIGFFLLFVFLFCKYFCSRNNRFNYTQSLPPVNTISRSVDVGNSPNSVCPPHTFVRITHPMYSDPPPSYDDIVLDVRLAGPNTSIVY